MVACGPADGGRVEESIRGGLSMDRTVYSGAEGFVVNYKTPWEPLLFNELQGRLKGPKLLERGNDAAAFSLSGFGRGDP